MATSRNLSSSSGSSKKRKRDERLHVDEAKISTTSTNYNCRLPPEIMEEILALLPIQSIYRFRSVSKSWSSFLVSVNFHKLRLKSTQPEITKLLYLDPKGIVISDYRAGVKTPTITNLCYPPPPADLGPGRKCPYLVGSCNGLVCLEYAKDYIVVWNPFTASYRPLPAISLQYSCYLRTYSFGYDSASHDYKVLLATRHTGNGVRLYIFSLKTGSWKKVENPDDTYLKCIGPWPHGLFLNGALYWETRVMGLSTVKKIFAFDLGKEKFYDVTKSPDYGYHSLGVVGEYLCICVFSDLDRLRKNAVWVMKEYCDEASWVPFITYYSPFDKDIAATYADYVCDFVPQSAKNGGYMILKYNDGNLHVLKWDNNLEESDRGEAYFKNIQFYRRDAIPYTEALASPYACMEINRGA
ncbi:hypothetical protein Tsubulata_029509 [Turnera subulata]|uniref:F-box domain-containing protein n=1 Tax=Turnera subulata TaxID=218843 RepID=A0A9Q0FYR6_9ROSI|nr:hypothetical protein Tsubulata_029509 [Turnera subulata]